MKKKLAIIRADADQIPLVEKAKEMGIETHCFSWDKTAAHTVCKEITDYFHPISILEKEKILEKCKELEIDGIISMSNNAMPTVAYVAQGMGLTGNHYEDTLKSTNKFSARQVFQHHGVSSPHFVLARENVDLTGLKYPLIVKPTDRKANVGLTKVKKEEDLPKAIRRAYKKSYCKEVIIEEFISGFEVSVDSISWDGEHYILAIKEREMGTGEFATVKIGGHCPIDLPSDVQDTIKSETQKALDAINFKYGASNTMFRVTLSGEVFIIEVNPRMPGNYAYTLMKLYNGYDYLKGAIDVALGQFEVPVISETKYAGVYFLTKETEWVRQVIENKEHHQDIVRVKMSDEKIRDLQNTEDKTGYFIYQSEQKKRWGPDVRLKELRRLIDTKGIVKVLEAHSALSGLIIENLVINIDGKRLAFDAMWSSSLTDSTCKGKPDIEAVDLTTRLQDVNNILECTTKPIIFDGDTGGISEHFVYKVRTLERLGISAVIIEDKIGLKKNSLLGTDVEQNQDSIEDFCEKIRAGKDAQYTESFMIIARIESLICGKDVDDALERAHAYVAAGADGIMIHSKEKTGEDIKSFCLNFRLKNKSTPIVLVPTTYHHITEDEFRTWGANIIIYANHMLRASYPAMLKVASVILENHRASEADKLCMPIKDILELIPGTK